MKRLEQKLQAQQLPVVQRREELQREQLQRPEALRRPEVQPPLAKQLALQLELGESELREGQQGLQQLVLLVPLKLNLSR